MRRGRLPGIVLPLVVLLSTGGCGEGVPHAMVVRDSAGVAIHESARSQWGDSAAWRVSAQPTVVIGSANGSEPYLLYRVSGAIVLPDGKIAVANGGSHEIRLFDATGVFVRSFGRTGSGPGEFRDLGLLAPYPPDSVLVFDRSLRRATILDAGLQSFRVSALDAGSLPGAPTVRFALDDGALVARLNLVASPGRQVGLWRDSLMVVAFDRDGAQRADLFRVEGDDRYTEIRNGTLLDNNHPLGRRAGIATDGRRVFLASGSTVAVDVYAADGHLQETWRAAVPVRPVDDAVVDRVKEQWKRADPDPEWSREVERTFEALVLPDALPAVDRIVVDATGCVWLRPFTVAPSDDLAWYVFDRTGVYLGRVPLPGSLRVAEIGADYVVGIGQGTAGTEEVQRYNLIRS